MVRWALFSLVMVTASLAAADESSKKLDNHAKLEKLLVKKIDDAFAKREPVQESIRVAIDQLEEKLADKAVESESKLMSELKATEQRLQDVHQEAVGQIGTNLESLFASRIEPLEEEIRAQKAQMDANNEQRSESSKEAEPEVTAAESQAMEQRLLQRIAELDAANNALQSKVDALSTQYDTIHTMYETLEGKQARLEKDLANDSSWQAWARERVNRSARNLGLAASYVKAHAADSVEWWNAFYDANLAVYASAACAWGQDTWKGARPTVHKLMGDSSAYAESTKHWAADVHRRWRPSLESPTNSIRAFFTNWSVTRGSGVDRLITVESLTAFTVLFLALFSRLVISLVCHRSSKQHSSRNLKKKVL